jgi:hopanoid C-3 methylase
MRFLGVHPSALYYSKIFLRLEPLGLELVAEALRKAGHTPRIIDLQADSHTSYLRLIKSWQPDVVGFSCNYLANVPEILDLARLTQQVLPNCSVIVGGHSASFTAREILEHSAGAVVCVIKGEGEASSVQLLEALGELAGATPARAAKSLAQVPGAVTLDGEGPPASFVRSLDDLNAARDLLPHRRKYFIGMLDPCASIEFSRGCPWDCTFCSAWTFYGRSYRIKSPAAIVDELRSIREPGVFIVDDVAFVQAKHGMEIGEALARQGIRKEYYLETRGDVLLRNKEVFEFWTKIGLKYMFLGVEAIDEEGLKKHRKRVTRSKNLEAVEFARSLGIAVSINLIVDPDWDRDRFQYIRDWCLDVPELVTISVNTPYPGTESWRTEARELITRDYRLFDIQHAVLPTRLPLREFYQELVTTQHVLQRKHLSWRVAPKLAAHTLKSVLRGQTNFAKMLCKVPGFFDPKLQFNDHNQEVRYEIALPSKVPAAAGEVYYIHAPHGRGSRAIDKVTEEFVDRTRMGTSSPEIDALAGKSAHSEISAEGLVRDPLQNNEPQVVAHGSGKRDRH